jgi:hypothetical protein
MAGSRYSDRPMPAARKVAGAFGREPQRTPAAAADAGGAMKRAGRNRKKSKKR